MKIAILSCNTGGGHNAAAAALAEELSARGHESRTYNTLDFLPKGAADLISRGHDFAYRYAPKLYGAGYRMEEKRPSPLLYENSCLLYTSTSSTRISSGRFPGWFQAIFPAITPRPTAF